MRDAIAKPTSAVSRAASLARIPLFRDAGDFDFATLEQSCEWRSFGAGETIIDYEDESSEVYFILSGDVRVLIRTAAGREIILADFKAGQFFGELAAIDGATRAANVSALTRAEVCVLPGERFRDILHRSPACCDRVLRLLTRRVRDLDQRLAEHTVLDVRHRLYAELLRLSSPRADESGARVVSPPPYHHVMAARIGCRREQVTRELSALAADGLVERARGGLVLLNPKALEARIQLALSTAD